MTRKFLDSIDLIPLDEYIAAQPDVDAATVTKDFYLLVLRRTDETVMTLFESYIGVFKNSTALNLVANLIRWAADAIPKATETLAARAEARDGLNGGGGV